MRESFALGIVDIEPDRQAVLQLQAVPSSATMSKKAENLLQEAAQGFAELAKPRALLETLTREEFEDIYAGEGRNREYTPLAGIAPRSDHLALFGLTLGKELSDAINRLFDGNELALAAMLDATSSAAAERAVELVSSHFLEGLSELGAVEDHARVLPYSPGYCGWHVSGQRRLFDKLQPREIGLELNDSFLMQPLKSVSGVLVVGPREIHDFDDDFDFCDDCAAHECRARIASVWRI